LNCSASNATFTINLLYSVVGVDYFNILQGPSNGLELLNFFHDALQVERANGSAALERGDVVVMDNCGFHHSRHNEPLLRNMLNTCGIELIYQLPYSPQSEYTPNSKHNQNITQRLAISHSSTVEAVTRN